MGTSGEQPSLQSGEDLEHEPIPSDEERLFKLLSFPEEVVAERRAALAEATERALATTVNPHEQEAIYLTAHIINWRLFADAGMPLPRGLVYRGNDDDTALKGSPSLAYDSRLSYGHRCAQFSLDQLERCGFVPPPTEEIIQAHEAELSDLVTRMVKESATYHFALSFDTSPSVEDASQPLSPYWHAVRKGQVVHGVLARYGVAAYNDIQVRPGLGAEDDDPEEDDDQRPAELEGYNIQRELTRKTWLIDEERQLLPTETSNNENSLDRAREYFVRFFREVFKGSNYEGTFIGFGSNDEGDHLIYTVEAPEGVVDEYWHLLTDTALRVIENFNEQSAVRRVLALTFLENFISELIWPTRPHEDCTAAAIQACSDATEWLLNSYIKSLRSFDAEHYEADYYGSVNNSFSTGFLRPQGEWVARLHDKSFWHKHTECSNDVCINSREMIDQLNEMKLGEVPYGAPAYARGGDAYRIIQFQPQQERLDWDGEVDLQIKFFTDYDHRDVDLYLPGFRLVSRDQELFGFVRDEEGDPYAPAEVRIAPAQREKLAACYLGAGLDVLAAAVHNARDLTVQRLVSIISEQSNYPVPSQDDGAIDSALPYELTIATLRDFNQFVRAGVLQVQCTGAAQFLKLSLEEIFGRGTANLTYGHMLERRYITEAHDHAQTVFEHEGRVYILDATPSRSSGGGTGVSFYNPPLFNMNDPALGTSPPSSASFTKIHGRVEQQEATKDTGPSQEELREREITGINRSLETQISVFMQAADRDALYERVVRLPLEDPLRRTLETTLRATYHEVSAEEVTAVWNYLQLYKESNYTLRGQMRIASYDPLIVESLQAAIDRLMRCFGSYDEAAEATSSRENPSQTSPRYRNTS